MRINERTAILTEKVLLVPYEERHVVTYHEWMKDEALLALTASEPLSLPEEHAMQRSWRQDHDKLTFIICAAPSSSSSSSPSSSSTSSSPSSSSSSPTTSAPIQAGTADAPEQMIGDINLFLTPDEDNAPSDDADNPTYLVGEIEIMIARPEMHRRGYGRAALSCFVTYVKANLRSILAEYAAGMPGGAVAEGRRQNGPPQREVELGFLRVKIGGQNAASMALFEGVGFRKVGGVNYFGEVEMRRNVEWMGDGEGGREVEYALPSEGEGEGVNGVHPADG